MCWGENDEAGERECVSEGLGSFSFLSSSLRLFLFDSVRMVGVVVRCA